MPWVKAHAGDNVNGAIEEIQEQYGCNKRTATEHLLRMGLAVWDEERDA